MRKSDNLLNDYKCELAEFLHLPEERDLLPKRKKCAYSLMFPFLCYAVSWERPKEEEAIKQGQDGDNR